MPMPDPNGTEPVSIEPEKSDNPLLMRILYMIMIAIMISLAQSVLSIVALFQIVILITNRNRPNPRLAAFGVGLGNWIAKAARYQSAASDTKPWPWTELD